jgi:hypothetical protein
MDQKEILKQYNKEYYANNKNKIIKQMTTKTECPDCSKLITKCNLNKHMQSRLCKKKVISVYDASDIETIKRKIEELTDLIKNTNNF